MSKQSVWGSAWFLLIGYSKMQEEENNLKTKLFIKREAEFKDLENSQFIHIAKNGKACFEENIKDVAEQSFDKDIMGMTFDLAILTESKHQDEIIPTKTLPVWAKENAKK